VGKVCYLRLPCLELCCDFYLCLRRPLDRKTLKNSPVIKEVVEITVIKTQRDVGHEKLQEFNFSMFCLFRRCKFSF